MCVCYHTSITQLERGNTITLVKTGCPTFRPLLLFQIETGINLGPIKKRISDE